MPRWKDGRPNPFAEDAVANGGSEEGYAGPVPRRAETETTMSLALQMKDYRLTTAEILYRLPDHPKLLQPSSGRTSTSPRATRCCGSSWISGNARWTASCTRCASLRRP